jgi:hypothetical protein
MAVRVMFTGFEILHHLRKTSEGFRMTADYWNGTQKGTFLFGLLRLQWVYG